MLIWKAFLNGQNLIE